MYIFRRRRAIYCILRHLCFFLSSVTFKFITCMTSISCTTVSFYFLLCLFFFRFCCVTAHTIAFVILSFSNYSRCSSTRSSLLFYIIVGFQYSSSVLERFFPNFGCFLVFIDSSLYLSHPPIYICNCIFYLLHTIHSRIYHQLQCNFV